MSDAVGTFPQLDAPLPLFSPSDPARLCERFFSIKSLLVQRGTSVLSYSLLRVAVDKFPVPAARNEREGARKRPSGFTLTAASAWAWRLFVIASSCRLGLPERILGGEAVARLPELAGVASEAGGQFCKRPLQHDGDVLAADVALDIFHERVAQGRV